MSHIDETALRKILSVLFFHRDQRTTKDIELPKQQTTTLKGTKVQASNTSPNEQGKYHKTPHFPTNCIQTAEETTQ